MSSPDIPVVETFRHSGLDPETCLIFGGAALALRNIRHTEDLDVMIEPDVFRSLSRDMLTPGGTALARNIDKIDVGEEYRLLGAIEPLPGTLPLDLRGLTKHRTMGKAAFAGWLERGEAVETSAGTLRVMRLEDILLSKVNSPRPKDRQDAIMIHRHLAQTAQANV